MKRAIIIILAIVAAIASGVAVFSEATRQMQVLAPASTSSSTSISSSTTSSDASLAAMNPLPMNPASSTIARSAAVYAAFTPEVIGNGERSVLFFHASWCPSCRQSDADLKNIYSSGAPGVSTYRVNYDDAIDLRSQYGVTSQHTFVLIDASGKAMKTAFGPTAEELLLLTK